MSTTKPSTAKKHMDSPQQSQQGQDSGAKHQQGDHAKTGGTPRSAPKSSGH